jgi:hypothetical protein
MLETCSRLALVIVRMPSMVESSSSRTSVMVVSITRGFAPRRVVLTETMGASTSGYSRTGRRLYPIAPKMTRARLIMLARTGRRMAVSERNTRGLLGNYERSIQDKWGLGAWAVGLGDWRMTASLRSVAQQRVSKGAGLKTSHPASSHRDHRGHGAPHPTRIPAPGCLL